MRKSDRAQSQPPRTCVLVLGMHRSGTSALAGVLKTLGCEAPAHQMAPSKSNAKGFFESTEIRDLNEDLLASAGSSWDDFTAFHGDWLNSPQAEEFLERAVRVLEGEFGDARLFVLKDPRICRLVPFWIEALERFGCVAKPILTIRNPIDVGQSLLSKRGMSEPVGQMLWLRHALDAEHATRGMPRCHTSFEQLMHGWELVMQAAQDSLQLVWPKSVASVEQEVTRFLSGDLQHHRDSPARTLTSTLLPAWLRETYAILTAWTEQGELSEDYPKLDRIRAEFDVASVAFARLVRAEREISIEQRSRAEEAREASRALQAELDGAVAKSREQRVAQDKLFEEQRLAYSTAKAKLEDERAARKDERARFEALLEEQRAARKDERERFEALIQEQRAGTEALRRELIDSEERRMAIENEKAELASELSAMRTQTKETIANLKASLQEERRRATLMNGDLHQLKEAREALEFQLAKAEAEIAENRARRKEAARVIARRDAEIQARFQELAILERQILESSLSWKLQHALRRLTGGRQFEASRPASS